MNAVNNILISRVPKWVPVTTMCFVKTLDELPSLMEVAISGLGILWEVCGQWWEITVAEACKDHVIHKWEGDGTYHINDIHSYMVTSVILVTNKTPQQATRIVKTILISWYKYKIVSSSAPEIQSSQSGNIQTES